jgi:hypothetical protein
MSLIRNTCFSPRKPHRVNQGIHLTLDECAERSAELDAEESE